MRVNKRVRRTELNIKKGDWEKYRQLVQRGVEGVEREMEPPRKLKMLTEIMNSAAKESCPTRAIRREYVPWMNAEIKQLRRSCNRTRRDMTSRRKDWVVICVELKEKTRVAKRKVWREQLERIAAEKKHQQGLECRQRPEG